MSTKVITGRVRFSYLNVFQPRAMSDGDTPKYSVSLIIDKKDTKTVDAIKAAIQAALEAGKGKFNGQIPAVYKNPLRDGDTERPGDPAYKGSYFVNANSVNKPSVVDEMLNDIIEPGKVYSGCYGRASINFYAFATKGNKGVACGLNHLQYLEEGEHLDGRTSADVDFGDFI